MTRFINGQYYPNAVLLTPPKRQAVPYVSVQMCIDACREDFSPVIGKIDTGSARTVLNAATAYGLGMDLKRMSQGRACVARMPNGDEITYYCWSSWVRVEQTPGVPLEFRLEAGFSQSIRANLFGLDWLRHVCLAVDRSGVHVLRM
jgi:hypothetical protein